MAVQRHDEIEINSPVSLAAQAVRRGLNESPPYYHTSERETPEASMGEAKRFKHPASEVGRLTLELFGYCLAFPLALFVVTGCTTPANRVRINQVQVIGTHNSYHLRSHESLRTLMAKRAPDLAPGLDYSHRPLTEQFSRLGIRQIELDCFADLDGGLFAEPRGPKVAAALGLPPVPDHDPEHRLRAPGFKVMHLQDIDYFSSVLTLKEGLQQVRAWSGHAPAPPTNLRDACASGHGGYTAFTLCK